VKGFPSVRDPGSIEKLLMKIVTVEPPSVVDREFLAAQGFRREADGALLELLGFLGFISVNGAPTTLWLQSGSTGGTARLLLGRAVRSAYADLFTGLPEAMGADGTVLMDFFRSTTGSTDPEAAYMVLTFKILCDLSEFSPEGSGVTAVPAPPVPVASPAPTEVETHPPVAECPAWPTPSEAPEAPVAPGVPVIRLSIHIDVSGDSDPQIRELAHRLLRSHLEAGGN
jgi:hypothetical protein